MYDDPVDWRVPAGSLASAATIVLDAEPMLFVKQSSHRCLPPAVSSYLSTEPRYSNPGELTILQKVWLETISCSFPVIDCALSKCRSEKDQVDINRFAVQTRVMPPAILAFVIYE